MLEGDPYSKMGWMHCLNNQDYGRWASSPFLANCKFENTDTCRCSEPLYPQSVLGKKVEIQK